MCVCLDILDIYFRNHVTSIVYQCYSVKHIQTQAMDFQILGRYEKKQFIYSEKKALEEKYFVRVKRENVSIMPKRQINTSSPRPLPALRLSSIASITTFQKITEAVTRSGRGGDGRRVS